MNASMIDRNTKACENGHFCEEYVKKIFPEIEWVGGTYDAVLNSIPVDVKGCEAWYARNDTRTLKRAGRVTLDSVQDAELKKLKGGYFCVVHFSDLIVNSFFVPAVRVEFSGSGKRQVSWTTIQKLAEVM